MSYILDALRKADAQRERDPARGIHAQPLHGSAASGASRAGRGPWMWGAAAGAAALGLAGWYLYPGHKDPEPSQAARAASPLPLPAARETVVLQEAAMLPTPAPVVGGAVLPAPVAPTPVVAAAIEPPAPPRPAAPPGRDFRGTSLPTMRGNQPAGVVMAQLPAGLAAPSSNAPSAAGSVPGTGPGVPPGSVPGMHPGSAPGSAPGMVPSPGVAPAPMPGQATQPAPAQPQAVQPPAAATPQPVAPPPPPPPAPPAPFRAPPPAPPAPPPPPVAGLPGDAPKLVITGGVYSTNPVQRMLIVNGQVFNEGSEVGTGVVLEEIKPKGAVLRFRGSRYTVSY